MPAPCPLPHTRTPLPQDHSKLLQPCNPQTTGTQAWLPRNPCCTWPRSHLLTPAHTPREQPLGPQELPARSSAPLHTGLKALPWTRRLTPALGPLHLPPPLPASLCPQRAPGSTPHPLLSSGQPQAKPSAEAPRVRALEPCAPWSPRSQQVVLRNQDQGSDVRRQTHVTHSLGRHPWVRGSAGSHRFGQLRGAQENGPTAGSAHRGCGSRQALWLPGPPPDTLRPAGARAAGGSRSRARPTPRPPPAPSYCLCRLPGLPPTAPPCPDSSAFSPAPHPAGSTRGTLRRAAGTPGHGRV